MFKSQRESFFVITLPLLIIFWIGVFNSNLKLIVGVGIGYALLRIIIWSLIPWLLKQPSNILINKMKNRNDLLIKNERLTTLAWIVVIFWIVAAPFDILYSYYLYKNGRIE